MSFVSETLSTIASAMPEVESKTTPISTETQQAAATLDAALAVHEKLTSELEQIRANRAKVNGELEAERRRVADLQADPDRSKAASLFTRALGPRPKRVSREELLELEEASACFGPEIDKLNAEVSEVEARITAGKTALMRSRARDLVAAVTSAHAAVRKQLVELGSLALRDAGAGEEMRAAGLTFIWDSHGAQAVGIQSLTAETKYPAIASVMRGVRSHKRAVDAVSE